MWPDLKSKIEAIPASGSGPKKARPQADILEELVAGIRSVEMRVRDMSDDDPSMRRRSRRRMVSPSLLMDLSHRVGQGPGDPIQILVFAGMFRDELPWLYELALDTYRSLREGDPVIAQQSVERFREALIFLRRGPFLDVMGMDDKMTHMIPMMLMDALEATTVTNNVAPRARPKRKLEAKGTDA
jgi:hypothetical protein